MKRAVAFTFLLACCGLLFGDSTTLPSNKPTPLLEELVRLTRSGAPDATVLAYAQTHRLELPAEVSDADLRWLRESGVSQRVVSYMRAIDIRIPDAGKQENVAYDSREAGVHRRVERSPADAYDDGYANNGYNDNNDYVGYDPYVAGAYDDYYPSYFGGYYDAYYAYPAYFILNGRGFHGRFQGGHRFGGHRPFDGGHEFRGHRAGNVGHPRSGESWRDRGFAGRRAGPIALGPRGSGRPAFQRGNVAAGSRGRGSVVGHGAPARPAFSRGGFPRGPGSPRGGAIGHGGVGHAGLPGGGHAGGFGRGPSAASGGGHVAPGPAGGRGRR
jgi:hypothetical protein